jgi:hypothetical protein
MMSISRPAGSVIIPRGGRRDGALLARIDVEGAQPIRLTETQFELLDGTHYFERR